MRALVLALLLAGCAAKQEARQVARAEPRYTSAPVVQRLPAKVAAKPGSKAEPPCVTEIPEEPPLIAGKLTGIVTYDIGLIEQSARDLRKALQAALGLLRECAQGRKVD